MRVPGLPGGVEDRRRPFRQLDLVVQVAEALGRWHTLLLRRLGPTAVEAKHRELRRRDDRDRRHRALEALRLVHDYVRDRIVSQETDGPLGILVEQGSPPYASDLPPELRDEIWAAFRRGIEPLRESGKLGAVFLPRADLGRKACRSSRLESRRIPE